MESFFAFEEIDDLRFKLKEIERISSKNPNLKYINDTSFTYSMLDITNSLSLFSLLLIDIISNDYKPNTLKFSKEYIIKKVTDNYNFMKIYEIEYIT